MNQSLISWLNKENKSREAISWIEKEIVNHNDWSLSAAGCNGEQSDEASVKIVYDREWIRGKVNYIRWIIFE